MGKSEITDLKRLLSHTVRMGVNPGLFGLSKLKITQKFCVLQMGYIPKSVPMPQAQNSNMR
jgi:hypothetical protein